MTGSKNRETIASLGEFGLIERLTGNLVKRQGSTLKGVGDDAAVIACGDQGMVVTTDLLLEGIHFNLMYMPLKHLGYKSVVVNLSDVYAMNATPRQITVSIAISSKFTLEMVEELYQGITLACEKYGVDLVGGDTTSSLTGMMISITALGTAPLEEITYRSGARPNELLCVSGDLGGAYMGLQLLERENEVYKVNPSTQPQLEGYDYILQRQLKPEARGDIVEAFRKMEIKPTAMIDISDGLSSEIMHICKASGTGCHLYEEKIPYDQQTRDMALEFNINPLVAALNGGEDYELLFTLPLALYDKVKEDPDITVIGHMTKPEEGTILVTSGGSLIPLQAGGFNHMKG
ncbi:MAG: thiamine-phosphate kinase [Prolixibacteraceae bacterium]|jgi:thiamine-monophosphate kinase|nr:thiamine-phosphate kinase [Prolixibacteraceae bacterium]MDI9563403.1 thiamine-phosphate kinase [Bacteroidota bacterium]NLS98521.1 thiamine-phosphate kinase [Bacteroidales bacterium]OQB80302.1 MAG: Thiamine-monophosphate kinase [Bacteroidetes bacterium ADurb.Bin123]HNZ69922.1 thiamine-phosphate kinase [Prolixibacteraceae bacterium]